MLVIHVYIVSHKPNRLVYQSDTLINKYIYVSVRNVNFVHQPHWPWWWLIKSCYAYVTDVVFGVISFPDWYVHRPYWP